jgi:hypothetical protein
MPGSPPKQDGRDLDRLAREFGEGVLILHQIEHWGEVREGAAQVVKVQGIDLRSCQGTPVALGLDAAVQRLVALVDFPIRRTGLQVLDESQRLQDAVDGDTVARTGIGFSV